MKFSFLFFFKLQKFCISMNEFVPCTSFFYYLFSFLTNVELLSCFVITSVIPWFYYTYPLFLFCNYFYFLNCFFIFSGEKTDYLLFILWIQCTHNVFILFLTYFSCSFVLLSPSCFSEVSHFSGKILSLHFVNSML